MKGRIEQFGLNIRVENKVWMMCHAYHHYCILTTVRLAIANAFMQWQESLFIFNF